ncbi:hypothetical protein [Kribbella lupini]|uniref:Uncharacterized protein n=1 Tax=Kribbella lupini TaxID=291602 RepID=A0ABP4LXH3_9ACTN
MSLLRFIAEVADEPLVLDPAAPRAEYRENTWLLSATEAELATLTAAEITTAFEQCADALRRRLTAEGHQSPAVFYVWHDAQAGQLRCSTTRHGLRPGDLDQKPGTSDTK